ncbi:hypothetical protein ACFQH9_07280 [Pseudonocardia lutea]|uniref:Phosphodiesterase n=1 Tax=Pseudonocardia lutea TaxID=2172015 RepID=A0ABW1I6S7_9PSEU
MIRTVFRALARVRRAPAFHPRGVLLGGELLVDDGGSAVAQALGPGPHRVLVRLSKGAGTPRDLPDLLGVAVRVEPDGSREALDLLFTTSAAGGTLLAPARGWRTATYSTLLPYDTAAGRMRLLVEPEPREPDPPADPRLVPDAVRARPLRYRLVEAPVGAAGIGTADRRAVATLVLGEERTGPVAFDPVLHQLPGLHPVPLLADLRARAYRGSRSGRHAAAADLVRAP